VAALVRFYRLDVTWFMLDQVRDVTAAAAIAGGDSLPLLGPKIGWSDAYLGPLYYYLLALPFAVTATPLAGPAFVAAANVLAVILLHGFARRFWGEGAALAAAALFGVFPLAVFSSRLVWHAGLVPLGTVLFMRSLFTVAVDGRSTAAVSMLALLAALTQLHLTAVAFVPVAILALVAARRTLAWRHVALGVAAGGLLYAPYLAHEVTHRFENLRALVAGAAGGGTASPAAFAAVVLNALLLYRTALEGFFPGEPMGAGLSLAWRLLYGAEALLLGAGVVIALGRITRRWWSERALGPGGRADAFLLLWPAAPLLVLGTRGTPMWWYYFDPIYPSQFVLAGIALGALAGETERGGVPSRARAGVAIGVAAALVLSQAAMVIAFQREAARRGELLLDVTRFPVNGAASPYGRLASLPLGLRSGLIRTLRDDFGIGEAGFAQRVHGAVLGLPEENDYLVRYWSARGPVHRADPRHTHYLVARDEESSAGLAPAGRVPRWARAGPYRIVEYRPMIDHASWRYGTVTAANAGAVPARWNAAGPTWPRLEVDVPPPPGALLIMGTLALPADAVAPLIAVSVAAWAPPGEIRLEVDGVQARPLGQALRQNPLMLRSGSQWLMGAGWRAEVLFDPGETLAPGAHVLEVRVAGAGRTLAVDVFERGRPGRGGGSG
jgi:hypothetical protein